MGLYMGLELDKRADRYTIHNYAKEKHSWSARVKELISKYLPSKEVNHFESNLYH